MKITIVYDNTAFRKDLQANWGFSALVETKERSFLIQDSSEYKADVKGSFTGACGDHIELEKLLRRPKSYL